MPYILWNWMDHYHVHVSQIESITSQPISVRSVSLLSFHGLLHLPSCLFPSAFPTKTLHPLLLSPMCVTCPAYLILLNLISQSYLLRIINFEAPHYDLFFYPLLTPASEAQRLFLGFLFSDTLSLCSSISVTDQVLHPYKTTDKIRVRME